MTTEIPDDFQEAEDAFERGDFLRASELYRKLSLQPDAPDSLLGNLVTLESLLVRSHLRRKLELEPSHVYARVLLAARVDSVEALKLYTELLEGDSLSPQARFRTLLQRFGLLVSKRLLYPSAASDFLEARRILAELNADAVLFGTLASLARIDSPTAIPVLREIAEGLGDDADAVRLIEHKIEELRILERGR
jgi:hypothetical protein